MSLNHLFIKNNNGLLVVGFPTYLAFEIAKYASMDDCNMYTDFSMDAKINKLDLLRIYKKDNSTEIPSLGLCATTISYLWPSEIGLVEPL